MKVWIVEWSACGESAIVDVYATEQLAKDAAAAHHSWYDCYVTEWTVKGTESTS